MLHTVLLSTFNLLFYDSWEGGKKKKLTECDSGEAQNCRAQEEPGKGWTFLAQAVDTMLEFLSKG